MVTPPTLRIDRSLRRSLRLFDQDRLRWLDEAAALGPLVNLKMGFANTWIVTDPDVARTVLVTEAEQWRRPPSAIIPIRFAVGENLFTQSDKHWALIQPSLSPAFRKRTLAPRLADLARIIGEQTAGVRLNETIDLEALTNRIALAVATWVLFGEELSVERADELAEHQRGIVEWVGERIGQVRSVVPFAPGTKARRMKQHRAALDAHAQQVLDRATKTEIDSDSGSVISALINARPNAKPPTAKQLRGHVLGLLFAGNETTAAALAWALVHGARNPNEWAKVRTDPTCAVAFNDETMRLSPVVWGFARSRVKGKGLIVSNTLSTTVSRTEVVTIYLRGMNRDPVRWVDPIEFRPDRHRETSVEQQRSLLPFGLGPRSCIGQHLALAELHEAIPALARLGNVELEREPVENPAFALRFAGGLQGKFTPADREVSRSRPGATERTSSGTGLERRRAGRAPEVARRGFARSTAVVRQLASAVSTSTRVAFPASSLSCSPLWSTT